MKLSTLLLVCVVGLFSSLSAVETVKITQKSSGKTIDVNLLGVESGMVSFTIGSAPKEYKISASDLTADSIERLKAQMAKAATATPAPSAPAVASEEALAQASKLNEIIGHNLFGEVASIWQESADDVAERLSWRMESKKKHSSSYRLYTNLDYTFLGAHPYCVTLYGVGGESNHSERLSLVYANKGDFGSRLGVGENHFKVMHPDAEPPGNLDDAIKFDADVLQQRLTQALGKPSQQYYGEKEDKRRVQRWDFGDHAFLLSSRESEYTTLVIVPTSNADVAGKVRFVGDIALKRILSENVIRKDNGDVYIDNLPMVDQGPKGYCAPATFERAMRYMRIPADMYLLATAATTPRGTDTNKLANDCRKIVTSKARKMRNLDLNRDFKIKDIKKIIDKGVPILWQMCSLDTYNDVANRRTREREGIEDFSKWASDIQAEATEKAGAFRGQGNYHICMIIGYNEETNEVAVSDSWGPRYELRWVHADIAKSVTYGGGFLIDF